jgi:hypothetical protein
VWSPLLPRLPARDGQPLLLLAPLTQPHLTSPQGDSCKLCRTRFDWNLFQRLQPGFEAKDYLFSPPPTLPLPSHDPALALVDEEALFAESSTKAKFLIEEIRGMERDFAAHSEKYATYLKR